MKRNKTCFLQKLSEISPGKKAIISSILKEEVNTCFESKLEFSVKELLEMFDVESAFLSTSFLNIFLRENREFFDLKDLSHGLLVSPLGFSKVQYQKLMITESDKMNMVLHTDVQWDTLFELYDIWKKECCISTYLNWLFAMAKFKLIENFTEYKTHVQLVVVLQVTAKLEHRRYLKIYELKRLLCKDHADFITSHHISEAIKAFRDYFVVEKTEERVSDWIVYTSSEKFQKVLNENNNMDDYVKVEKEESERNSCTSISLTDEQEKRVLPLLTLKVKYENTVNIFKNLKKKGYDDLINEILQKHGCFLTFLTHYCKVKKPKLNHSEYKEKLENLIKQELYDLLNNSKEYMDIITIMEKMENLGNLNKDFLFKVVKNSPETFRIFENMIALKTVDIPKLAEESQIEEKKFRDAGLFRIIRLTVSYRDIRKSFFSLPRHILKQLHDDSLSYLEFLVKVSKKYRTEESQDYTNHLCMLVHEEICFIIGKKREITIQRICNILNEKSGSMLISGMFLKFVLDRCKEDSKIYVSEDGNWIKRISGNSQSSNSSYDSKDHVKEAIPYSRFVISFQQELLKLPPLSKIIERIHLEGSLFSKKVLSEYSTWLMFLRNTNNENIGHHLDKIIRDEMLHKVKHLISVDTVIEKYFSQVYDFSTTSDLINIAKKFPENFAVVTNSHGESIIGVKRNLNKEENVDFYNEFEKKAVYGVLWNTNDKEGTTNLTDLWKKLIQFNEDVYEYIFGIKPSRPTTSLSYTRYEAFLETYPGLFCIKSGKLILTVPGVQSKREAIKFFKAPQEVIENIENQSNNHLSDKHDIDFNGSTSHKRTSEMPETSNKRVKFEPIAVYDYLQPPNYLESPTMDVIKEEPVYYEEKDIHDVKPIFKVNTSTWSEVKSYVETLDEDIILNNSKQILQYTSTMQIKLFISEIIEKFPNFNYCQDVKDSIDLLRLVTEYVVKVLRKHPHKFEIINAHNNEDMPTGIKIRSKYKESLRHSLFMEFFSNSYLYSSNLTATEIVSMAYDFFCQRKHYSTKRYDSFLGYVYTFFFKYNDKFSLENSYGTFGLSRIIFNKNSTFEIEPLLEYVRQYVKSLCQGNGTIDIDELIKMIQQDGYFKMIIEQLIFEDVESETRALVCTALFHPMFHFPPNTSIVKLTGWKNMLKDESWNKFKEHIPFLKRNPKIISGLIALMKIIETTHCTSQHLKKIWIKRAPENLKEVFGRGVSLSLNMEKYSFVYNQDPQDKHLKVNLDCQKHLENMLEK